MFHVIAAADAYLEKKQLGREKQVTAAKMASKVFDNPTDSATEEVFGVYRSGQELNPALESVHDESAQLKSVRTTLGWEQERLQGFRAKLEKPDMLTSQHYLAKMAESLQTCEHLEAVIGELEGEDAQGASSDDWLLPGR